MPKKEEKIEVRIDTELKRAFSDYAKQKGISISALIRNFIKECITENGKIN